MAQRDQAKPKVISSISIENAVIRFRNFSGEESRFNPAGRRNFCVFLDLETAARLEEDGWNVRYRDPREEGDEREAYIQVAVSFDNFPPRIILISGNSKTQISGDAVNVLDWAEITSADLVIRPYNWEVSGKSGVKAYLKSLYVTIAEDEFAKKYRDIPEAGAPFSDDD